MDISVTTDLMVFFDFILPYLWQCILSGGTRNDDKNLHVPKTCSRSIIYNNSLMQWIMSIMRFCICLNVHRETFHLTKPCALHRAVHMLHAHNRYSLACLSLLFISIAFSFVIRDIKKSLYTAMTAYMSKALIMAFVLFLYIDFLHMFMLLFNFIWYIRFRIGVLSDANVYFFYRTISVWIPYTSIIKPIHLPTVKWKRN